MGNLVSKLREMVHLIGWKLLITRHDIRNRGNFQEISVECISIANSSVYTSHSTNLLPIMSTIISCRVDWMTLIISIWQFQILTTNRKEENILGEGENAGNQHFLLSPLCFSITIPTANFNFLISSIFVICKCFEECRSWPCLFWPGRFGQLKA